MLKIIMICLSIVISQAKYDFGENVNIIGIWNIQTQNKEMIDFLNTVGNKWDKYEFRDNGFIYKDNKPKGQWRYTLEIGEIEINAYLDSTDTNQYKERANNIFVQPLITSTRKFLKISKNISYDCYLVNITSQNNINLKMCKTAESKKTKNLKEKPKAIITIE